MVPLKVHEASNARDALAKAIYSRLFDYIVAKINASIPFQVCTLFLYKSPLDSVDNNILWPFLSKKDMKVHTEVD